MSPRTGATGTASKSAKRERFREWIEREKPESLSDPVWARLRADLGAALSEDDLRHAARETGLPMSPLVEGVRQDSYAELARTLTALSDEYASGGDERRKECRRLVIRAKDRAKWASRRVRDEWVRQEKEEMARWMLVWLENPPVFEVWVRGRGEILQSTGGSKLT